MNNKKTKAPKKTDYNIEYAHIYTNEQFGAEQKKSIKELKKIIEQLEMANETYVLTVLIDDYNPSEQTLDIQNFLTQLVKFKTKPDFVGFESDLAPYAKIIQKELKGKIKKEYKNYIKNHSKTPCSLLAATWYLQRLGLIKVKNRKLKRLIKSNKPFAAKNIITILPRKYQSIEEKSLQIIGATKFERYLKNITNIFFD